MIHIFQKDKDIWTKIMLECLLLLLIVIFAATIYYFIYNFDKYLLQIFMLACLYLFKSLVF